MRDINRNQFVDLCKAAKDGDKRALSAVKRIVKRHNPPLKPCSPGDKQAPNLVGEKVRVHVNLHNGCYVITHKGKVAGYVKSLTLADVTPKISMSGYKKCKDEQQRNVHAFLEGTLISMSASTPSGWEQITYNCKTRGPHFYYTSGGKFEGSDEVRFVRRKQGDYEYVEVYAK